MVFICYYLFNMWYNFYYVPKSVTNPVLHRAFERAKIGAEEGTTAGGNQQSYPGSGDGM